ncbi:MAG: hypothetical protein ACI93R_003474 [Flavobacteriales bacterium]|jgi:membrane protein implicated in regulation of membrane protease activity
MDILQYFSGNHAQLLYLIAGISFVVELTVMGLGGPLLFFAIACFITGMLSNFGILSGWESEVFSVGLLTGLIALVLWKPLKKFQNSSPKPDTSSDLIGRHVPCVDEITITGGSVRHSGINWNARLASGCNVESIPSDSHCEITGVDGNVVLVAPVKKS